MRVGDMYNLEAFVGARVLEAPGICAIHNLYQIIRCFFCVLLKSSQFLFSFFVGAATAENENGKNDT